MSKYGHRPGNWFEAIVNKIGGEERADRLLRGELRVVENDPIREPIMWYLDVDDTIRFSFKMEVPVKNDWCTRLGRSGVHVIGDDTKEMLVSKDFTVSPHSHHEILVLRAASYNQPLTTRTIRSIAGKKRLSKPHPNVVCLFAEKLRGVDLKAMGVQSIIFMHTPITIANDPLLFELSVSKDGFHCELRSRVGTLSQEFNHHRGFAFMLEWPPA